VNRSADAAAAVSSGGMVAAGEPIKRIERTSVGAEQQRLHFGPFCLDRLQSRLLAGPENRTVPLTPKAFDLLSYLVARGGMLVKKDELMSALWSDTIVGDASIKVAVREIRKALGDNAVAPKYIETVHRRGYRFIAPTSEGTLSRGSAEDPPVSPSPTAPQSLAPSRMPSVASAPNLFGRDLELDRLMRMFDSSPSGQRRFAFLSGAPGSGKTALIDAFVSRVTASSASAPLVLVGHCFEQFGAGEPYLPVWEAVTSAATQRNESPLASLVTRYAQDGREPVVAGATEPPAPPQRLLRDLIDAIEATAAETPLLFVLEDVQWVDHSTLDLLSALVRRGPASVRARLMIVATYRPAAGTAGAGEAHPLYEFSRELLASRLAERIELGPLDRAAIEAYLAARFVPSADRGVGNVPADFAARLLARTEGQPLFLVQLIDELVAQGVIPPRDAGDRRWIGVLESQIPSTVRAMIDAQFRRLTAGQQEVLECAAVAGVESSAAAIAAGMAEGGGDVVAVERACDELARRNCFLKSGGVADWADGTVASSYRFVHELYRDVVYQSLGEARRAQLHRAVGARLEAAYAQRAAPAGERAAELAMHAERGRDWRRALRHLRDAADAAARQYAHREVVDYLRRAQVAIERLPADQQGPDVELPVLVSLGANLQMLKGWAAPQVQQLYARADALIGASAGQSGDDVRRMFPVLWGVWLFHKVRSDLARAGELAERLHQLARQSQDPSLLMQAHQAMAVTALCQGRPAVTRDHMLAAERIYDAARDATNTRQYGQDPGVATAAFGAVALWLLGDDDAATAASARSLEWAQRTNQPSTRALALHFAAMLHQLRGDHAETGRVATSALRLAEAEEFPFWRAGAMVLGGWAHVAARPADAAAAAGVDQIRRGLDDWLATGSRTYQPYYLGLLADALLRSGRDAEAAAVLDEAIGAARKLPEGLYEAELLRLRGVAMKAESPHLAVESVREAIEITHAQGARSFESRARVDLEAMRS
jgi:DNA-binding winged helix-turn-helix (wHTH) protein/predicted ATPase